MKKLLSRKFTAFLCLLLTIILSSQPILACSWDYDIWQNRHKNSDPYYRFIKDGKVGFIDGSGKIVVEPTLPNYGNTQDGIINGLLEVDSDVYVDIRTGKKVSEEYYQEKTELYSTKGLMSKIFNKRKIYLYGKDKFEIKSKNRVGYVNQKGKVIIEPKFFYGEAFNEGVAAVVMQGSCYIPKSDDSFCPEVINLPFGAITQSDTICKFNLIDEKGNMISNQTFYKVKGFSEGLAPVLTEKGWGYINKTGKMVIAPQFDSAEPFSDGLALIKKSNLFGYISKDGAIVIQPQFKRATSFSDGLASVSKTWDEEDNERFGYYFINFSGKQDFPEKFILASHYFKGIAHVLLKPKLSKKEVDALLEKDEKVDMFYAYIDTKGNKVFTYKQEDID